MENETKSKLLKKDNIIVDVRSICIIPTYRTWQIGSFCSKNFWSNLIASVHVDGALTVVVGDCQYVLLRETVALHLVIASVLDIQLLKFEVLFNSRYE